MEKFDKKAFGSRIRETRERRGIMQEELAGILGCTTQRLQLIESGETDCDPNELMIIAQILKISTDYLLCGEDAYEEVEERVLQLLEGKTEEQKKYLYKMLNDVLDKS